ncbi:MAG: hypothetical protein J0I47_06200 [Sphingomonas sp.]|uniref:hypothetical protein n=1 Tax=Sphingomonas sp. TaxID=28214 RepID=UPI001AC2E877|nr:hypothetical protein [Sphingomonas sp.]MBN8807811.1 hypothetical protein [Sphingomonas sp.]
MLNEVEIAGRYVHAVTRMTLGHKMLKSGLALLAGGPIDMAKRIHLAQVAKQSDCDLIHLTLDHVDGDYRMTGIHICAPRDIAVYTYPECRLSLVGKHAIIIPPKGGRGHFELTPRELIHRPHKPDGWEEGIDRAERRLRDLVEQEVDTAGQIDLYTVPRVA